MSTFRVFVCMHAFFGGSRPGVWDLPAFHRATLRRI